MGVGGWDGVKYNVRHFSRQFWRATGLYILIVMYRSYFFKSNLNISMTWRQCNVKRDHLHQNTHENIWLLCTFYEFLHRYRWHLHMSDIFLRNILNNSYYTPSITYWMLQQTFTTVETCPFFSGKAKFNK